MYHYTEEQSADRKKLSNTTTHTSTRKFQDEDSGGAAALRFIAKTTVPGSSNDHEQFQGKPEINKMATSPKARLHLVITTHHHSAPRPLPPTHP